MSEGIRAIEQLSVRRRLRPYLVEHVEVWRPALSSDGAGGKTKVYSRVATLPARFSANTDGEQTFAMRLGTISAPVLTLEASADVRVDDQLRTPDGRVFEVSGRDVPRSYQMTQRVYTRELR